MSTRRAESKDLRNYEYHILIKCERCKTVGCYEVEPVFICGDCFEKTVRFDVTELKIVEGNDER